jgi:hypothetical protein
MKYCKHVGDNVQMEAGDGETQKINSAKDFYNVLCDKMSISHRDFIDRKGSTGNIYRRKFHFVPARTRKRRYITQKSSTRKH